MILHAVALFVLLLSAAPTAAQQAALVTGIVDGDTIHVVIGNQTETVRYIGINTPEIHHPTKGRQPGGDPAREINRALVEGKWVTLYYDAQQRDRYGRLLAYVYINGQLVNGELVSRGYAQAATFPPNVYFADYFRQLERAARDAQRGLWRDPNGAAILQQTPWRRARDEDGKDHDDHRERQRRAVRREPGGSISIAIPQQVEAAMERAGVFRARGGAERPSTGGPVHVDAHWRGTTWVDDFTRRLPTK